MTHDQAIAEQRRLFGNGPTSELPTICMSLRAGVNGSSDEWRPADIRACLSMLRLRLATWAPSVNRMTEGLDNAVKALVGATIDEVESYAWWKETA